MNYKNIVFIDGCENFYENCPPGEICDCWPTIFTDYKIKLRHDFEIAVNSDSTSREFSKGDTISANNIWFNPLKSNS
jgi:hypothetical protein